MGERKVINQYYPPDLDPSKIPPAKKPKNGQIRVRTMLQTSARCSICGNYISEGTKFNSRKEDVIGEYLGIQIHRLYSKCSKCSAEITVKTDPQNSGYVVESGASATRNFEPWHAEQRKRNAEEMGNVMKSLENKALESKREMSAPVALHELKAIKQRQASVSIDEVLKAMRFSNEQKQRKMEEEDEALVRSFFKVRRESTLRRIDDDDIDYENLDFTCPQRRKV